MHARKIDGYGNANQPRPKPVHFVGKITATSRDGTGAFVLLDSPTRAKYAVISSNTAGCVQLMNGNGHLVPGVRVEGMAELGSESLRAISVTKEKVHA